MIDKVVVHSFVRLLYAVMWGLHVDYITSAMGHTCLMWKIYMFGAYASNVKCMYTSVSCDIVDYSELI